MCQRRLHIFSKASYWGRQGKGKWNYLKIGDGVWGGEPGGAGVLLVAEGPVEGESDGAQIERTHSRG